MPFVSNAYLIKASTIKTMAVNPFHSEQHDQDMSFCENNRQRVKYKTSYFEIIP